MCPPTWSRCPQDREGSQTTTLNAAAGKSQTNCDELSAPSGVALHPHGQSRLSSMAGFSPERGTRGQAQRCSCPFRPPCTGRSATPAAQGNMCPATPGGGGDWGPCHPCRQRAERLGAEGRDVRHRARLCRSGSRLPEAPGTGGARCKIPLQCPTLGCPHGSSPREAIRSPGQSQAWSRSALWGLGCITSVGLAMNPMRWAPLPSLQEGETRALGR